MQNEPMLPAGRFRLIVRLALLSIFLLPFSGSSFATRSYLNDVNATCGTNYGCDLCHLDPGGGGPLNPDGAAFRNAGHDPAYFCPGTPVCTDGDNDGFNIQGGDCGPMDCNDMNAAVNPGAKENCFNGIDDDCNDLVDAQDPACGGCVQTVDIERGKACSDGVDNDCNGFTDCDDASCSTNRMCKSSNEGKGKTCSDGLDNDQDGLVDCSDSDCANNRSCR
jgi:hypothetical protein